MRRVNPISHMVKIPLSLIRNLTLICLFCAVFVWLPDVSKAESIGLDEEALKNQLADIAVEKFFSKLPGIPEDKLKDATYFNSLVSDMAPLGVKLDETNFTETALTIYNKYKEAIDKGETPEKARENVKALVKADVKAVIYASLDKGSQEIVNDLDGLYKNAEKDLTDILNLNKELEEDPKADYAELIKKYGIKGETLEKFEKLEGQLRGAYEKNGDYIKAAQIIYSGMSGSSGDKIEALFELGDQFGGKIPVIGRFVELYFKVAKDMVAATGRLAKILEQRQAGCLGVGTVGFISTVKSAENTRNVIFSKNFSGTVCPVNQTMEFWKDVYEDINKSGQLYFWTGDGFETGDPKYGGVEALKALRGWLRTTKHADKASDMQFMIESYNFNPGFLTLKTEVEDMVNSLIQAFSRVDKGGYCMDIDEFNKLLIDKAGLQHLVDSSYGALRIESGRRFSMGSWDVPSIVDKILIERYIDRKGTLHKACKDTMQGLGNIIFAEIRGKVELEAGQKTTDYAGVTVTVDPADRILAKCRDLTTNGNGLFYFQLVKDAGESISLDLEANDGKNTPGKASVSVGGSTTGYSVTIKIKGACPQGYKFDDKGKCVPDCKPNEKPDAKGNCVPACKDNEKLDANGKCVPVCGANEELVNDECVCKAGFERDDQGKCVPVQDKCKENEEKNAAGKCVCKAGFGRDDQGKCAPVKPKCDTNEELNADGKCVCKAGYERNDDGKCVPGKPKCGTNEELNADGECVCKSGYERDDEGKCVKAKPKCETNEVLNADGECVCKSGYERNDEGKCEPAGQKCEGDDDCPKDYVCKSGKCVYQSKPPCQGDDDCPQDYVCKSGKCVYQSKPPCQGDDDCPQDYVCKSGKCVYQSKPPCQGDDDCPKDYVCKSGKCVYQSKPPCQGDDDCPKGYECKNGKCVFQKADCRRDGCASGYQCDSKTGNCVFIKSGCSGDGDCKKGYVCSGGKCVSPFDDDYDDYTDTMGDRDDDRGQNQADTVSSNQSGGKGGYTSDDMNDDMDNIQDGLKKGCKKNSDCKSGYACQSGECVKQQRCSDDSDCGQGKTCKNGQCVKVTDCKKAGDCPPNHTCKNGKCVPVTDCKKAGDCPQGQTCKDGKCVAQTTQKATLSVSPANMAVVLNESVNLKATFTDTDGSTKDVTGEASWNPSPNFSKGTIGVYTVTASHKGLTATSQITVVKEKGMDDITVNQKNITVTFWDHGVEDGDMIDILINGEVVFGGITLTNAHQSKTIKMNADIIVVGFKALNVGSIPPNTATVTFTSVTAGKDTQTYELNQDQEANMNMTYKP